MVRPTLIPTGVGQQHLLEERLVVELFAAEQTATGPMKILSKQRLRISDQYIGGNKYVKVEVLSKRRQTLTI